MLIDWFTVGAQIVNFLILVWLLKRVLYKPILSAMDQRERTIAANLDDAAATKAEAEQQQAAFVRKNQEFDGQRQEMLKQAEATAEKEYQDLLEEKRTAVQTRQDEWHKGLAAEQGAFLAELEHKAKTELLAVARQVLADLAGADLEERMVAVFIRRLEDALHDQTSGVAAMVLGSSGPLTVKSAAPLSPVSRQAILAALRQDSGRDSEVVFAEAPELVAGIELVTGGQKISWTMAGYMRILRQHMEEILGRNERHDVGE